MERTSSCKPCNVCRSAQQPSSPGVVKWRRHTSRLWQQSAERVPGRSEKPGRGTAHGHCSGGGLCRQQWRQCSPEACRSVAPDTTRTESTDPEYREQAFSPPCRTEWGRPRGRSSSRPPAECRRVVCRSRTHPARPTADPGHIPLLKRITENTASVLHGVLSYITTDSSHLCTT